MTVELRDRPIAITGASSGIGRATAVACARAGMLVAAAARREDRLKDLVTEIRGFGGRAIAVACDVVNPGECTALVDRTIAEFGSIYSVFANAGYGIEKPINDMTDEEWRSILETNFFGTLSTIRSALPAMLKAGTGHVLICTSCVSKIALPRFGAYTATKAAQDHVGRALRLELSGTGVHVSTVHPIGTTTEFQEVSALKSGRGTPASHTPRMFLQTPERVAGAVVACLRRPRPEVWTSHATRLLFALGIAFPRLADGALARTYRKKA